MTTSNTNKIPKVCKVLGHFTTLDVEWDYLTHRLLAASFVDNLGCKIVYLNKGSEIALLEDIIVEILNHDYSIGWNSSTSIDKGNTDSTFVEGNNKNTDDVQCDLGILYERCKANNIENIISKSVTTHRTYYRINGLKHIDLYQVYSKQLVQDTVYNRRYRTHKLDDVSHALLGYGKFKGFSGKDFLKLSISDRKAYVLRDSELVMNLSKYNNYELLDAMLAIAEITGLEFDYVCRTNLTTWWGKIFDKMIEDGECPEPFNIFDREHAKKYKGASVLRPKQGLYHNTILVDAASLYPTMGIQYNLSFDTINCRCCKRNPHAKIRIDEKYFQGCKYISKTKCWICTKHEGAFAKKLRIFRKERLEQKRLGNEAKQLALKILINGGYGCFGNLKFKFYNPLVGEFVTTFGRYTLSKMQAIAKKLGFEIIYGDTDSLFLNNPASENLLLKYQTICNKKLNVEQEIKKQYNTLLLSAGKKHYIGDGVGDKGKPIFDIVGYEGIKSNYPQFIHNIFRKSVISIIKNNTDPIPNLRKAMHALVSKQVNPNLLKLSMVLGKELNDYDRASQIYNIGKTVNAKKGELVEYFDANIKKTGKSWSRNPRDIDVLKYKQKLWNRVSEVLEIAGYPTNDLAKQFGVRTNNRRKNSNSHDDAEPSRGVTE